MLPDFEVQCALQETRACDEEGEVRLASRRELPGGRVEDVRVTDQFFVSNEAHGEGKVMGRDWQVGSDLQGLQTEI